MGQDSKTEASRSAAKHHKLAAEAADSIKEVAPFVSEEVAHKLKLAYVAQWLANQDLDCQASAARTAVAAIDWLHLIRANAATGSAA